MPITRFILIISFTLLLACSSTKKITQEENRELSSVPAEQITESLPDYTSSLKSVSGRGRAIVSEPGNSDRVTLDFKANRSLTLITAKNRLGIEGGKMLVDQDSILIYNRIDKIAQKISIQDARLTSLNEFVSINAIELLNYPVSADDVRRVMESDTYYILILKNGAEVSVDKNDGFIKKIRQLRRSNAPYSLIEYSAYKKTKGFTLPSKISIFSSDQTSRVSLTIRSLTVNPDNLKLELTIPDKIQIERL